MESVFFVELPVRSEDLVAIESMVCDSGILFHGNYRGTNIPRVVEYQHAALEEKAEFYALFDRNLISRLVRLADGKAVPTDIEGARAARTAAAALCFCALSNVTIEPNISLYELADSEGHAGAQREERLFRIADNCAPVALANVALGRSDYLHVDQSVVEQVDRRYIELVNSEVEQSFTRSLRKWKLHYLLILKTVVFMRDSDTPVVAARKLLSWQFEDAFVDASACLYCLNAISHRPPKGKMIKGIRSEDPIKTREGVRNATWDAFLLSSFNSALKRQDGKLWSLWSADEALTAVASHLFIRDSYDADSKLREDIVSRWGAIDGLALTEEYFRLREAVAFDSISRQKHLNETFAGVNEMIRELEIKLAFPATSRWAMTT